MTGNLACRSASLIRSMLVALVAAVCWPLQALRAQDPPPIIYINEAQLLSEPQRELGGYLRAEFERRSEGSPREDGATVLSTVLVISSSVASLLAGGRASGGRTLSSAGSDSNSLIECPTPSQDPTLGERVSIPSGAVIHLWHERGPGEEEIELPAKWKTEWIVSWAPCSGSRSGTPSVRPARVGC